MGIQNSDEHLYANHEHIIRTSQQWNETYLYNKPIPRGVLCIELTPKNHTRLKVGEGDKFYRQLPYIDGDAELSNYYTKQEIDQMFANLQYMQIASDTIYESRNALPKTGNRKGDVRFVVNPNIKIEDPLEYLWNGKKWIQLGGNLADIDLSEYAKKSEVNPRLDRLEQQAHTHANKAVLDATTAPYTMEEKSKLAGLKNYDDTQISRRVTTLESKAHTHANKDILDATTASYTRDEKIKLAGLHDYDVFVGTDGTSDGTDGLVPGPTTEDANKFLASDGTWKTVTSPSPSDTFVEGDGIVFIDEVDNTTSINNTGVLDVTKNNNGNLVISKRTGNTTLTLDHYSLPTASDSTLGGIKVGDELHIDSNGVLSGNTYVEGDGIHIAPPDSYEVLSYVRSNKAGQIFTGLFCTTGTLTVDLKFNYPVNVQTLGEYQLIVLTYNRPANAHKPGDIGYGVVNFTSPGSRLAVGKYYDDSGTVRSFWNYSNSYTTGDFQDHCVWNYSTYGSNIGTSTLNGTIPANDEICVFQSRTDVILYWMKIYDDTTMIADLVPVRNMTTNELGLYNRVTDAFLPITVPGPSGNSLIGGTATGEIIGDVEGLYAITNTGVLDVTKDNNGDLVVSTINGDTTLSLDHYSLPTASASTLGGIKVGNNLSIDANGVLSATGGGTGGSVDDVSLSQTTPGGLTITNVDTTEKDLDVFSTLGQITLICTQNPSTP